MTLTWRTRLPQSDKLVLLALSDNANDQGLCWPSVQTLMAKCGMDDRTIQRAIRRLAGAGHVTVNQRAGRSSYYTVHPRQDDTPVRMTPPSQRRDTPVTATGHPRQIDGQNPQGTSKEPGEARAARAPTATRLPDGIQLTEEMRAYAVQCAISPEGAFTAFCDYWRAESGAKARKHDWLAAWRTWCRRTTEAAQRQRPSDALSRPAARPPAQTCDHGLSRATCVYCRRAAAVPA